MVKIWQVVEEPKRRAILDLLRGGDLGVGDLSARLGMSQPQASKHLRVLREAGLVVVRVDAQRRIYALDPTPMREIDAWLEPYRRFWNRHLDRLGDHLDSTDSTTPQE